MKAPLHICLIGQGGDHWLGGHYYCQHIIHALEKLPATVRQTFRLSYMVEQPLAEPLPGPLADFCNVIVAPEVYRPDQRLTAKIRRQVRRQLGLRNPQMHDFLRRHGVDFAYPCSTGGEKTGGYRTAHWIADLQFKHFPQFQLPAVLAGQASYLGDIAANASTVVVSSQYGAEDCQLHYPLTLGRTFVLPFRVAPPIDPKEGLSLDASSRYHLPNRFLLVCNQFWQNKNHGIVFEALGHLKQSGVEPTVVCTGHFYDPRLPKYIDALLAKLHTSGVAAQVRLLGAIPRSDQVDLLRRTVALIQPSLFEGWNTSIEEAHYFGRTVIASDIPVHREQQQGTMSFFDPTNAAALAERMAQAWAAPGLDGQINPASEAAARARYDGLVREFADRFLRLAFGSEPVPVDA